MAFKTSEELMVIYQNDAPDLAYQAFEVLYHRHSQKLFSYLIKGLQKNADAEDLLQKTFAKVHESKHLYNPKYKFEQWLFVIAKTSVLDHFRSVYRYQKRINQIEIISEKENSDMSHPLNLDQAQKELLEMKFVDELSYQEIAKILNKSETSLRKTVSRLISRLKKEDA